MPEGQRMRVFTSSEFLCLRTFLYPEGLQQFRNVRFLEDNDLWIL